MDLVPGHGHVPVVHADASRARTRCSARSSAASRISRCAAGSSSRTSAAFHDVARRLSRRSRRPRRKPRPMPRRAQALYAVCAACHGAQGEGNPALNAPKLGGQGDWYLQRQLQHFKNGVRGAHEQDTFGKMMAPMAATLADDAAIDNVVAYIETLPGHSRAAPTVTTATRTNGATLYATCAACHGADGPGHQATNAPRLTGMSDWYMVTQLKNFKHGIRGTAPAGLLRLRRWRRWRRSLNGRRGDRRRRRLHQHAEMRCAGERDDGSAEEEPDDDLRDARRIGFRSSDRGRRAGALPRRRRSSTSTSGARTTRSSRSSTRSPRSASGWSRSCCRG